jgi:site-specific DNA recombinase
VRGIIAEYERAKILERTARGRTGRGRAGHVPPGPATMGYIYVKHPDKGAHYEIHPEEAALVRRIFGLCVEERRSLESIAALLTAEGVPPPGARPGRASRALTPIWHRSTISVILRNTAYIGPCMMGNASGYPGNATRITRRGCVSSPENSGRLLPSRPSLHPNSLKRPSSSSRPIKSRASGIGRRNTYSSPDGSAVDSVAAP